MAETICVCGVDEPVDENPEGDADGQEGRIEGHDGPSLVEEEDILLCKGQP